VYYNKIPILFITGLVLVTAPGCASRSKTPHADQLPARSSAAQADFRRMITAEIADPARLLAAFWLGGAAASGALLTEDMLKGFMQRAVFASE
jgi:hypothetical protein